MLRLIYIPVVLLAALQSNADLKVGQTKAITTPFYLEGSEVKKLKSELIKMKFAEDNFVLKFICDKKKKSPKARNRSINCVAVSVSPEPVTGEGKPNLRRRSKRQ